MVGAARAAGRKLMVGQCLRFDPNYLYLKEQILAGTYGKLHLLKMHRRSIYPTWGANQWFQDRSKCGGCVIDTHIHDVDVARFLLGDPDSVSAVVFDNIPHCQYVNTRLYYEDAVVIVQNKAVTVMLAEELLNEENSTRILTLCVAHCGVGAENVRIMGKK